MNKSESITKINKALVEFHKQVKQPMKDANNPFFKSKYVPLENVVEAIDEVAPSLGLSFTQWASNDTNGRVGVSTMLLHESGEYIEYDPVYMKADKETAQGAGALISYLKRYSLSAVFGITSDQDDDANQASGHTNRPKQQASNTQNKQTPAKHDASVMELEQEMRNFIDLLTSLDKKVSREDVLEMLKIEDVKQLNKSEVASKMNKLKSYANKYKEQDNNAK